MTSSLLFAGSTTGFAIGTLLVERIVKCLARFDISSGPKAYIPTFLSFSSLPSPGPKNTPVVVYSNSKSRFIALFLSSVLHACFFVIMGTARNFPTLFIAYVVAAFARAFLTASLNAYVSLTPKKTTGIIFGCWSVGSFASPLVCQTIIAKGVPWQNFYLGSLVLSAINTSFIAYSFRPTHNEYLAERKAALESQKPASATPVNQCQLSSATCPAATVPVQSGHTLKRALCMPYQWAFSFMSWMYNGSETTMQGFIVTYLSVTRNANPNTVGYVSSGFWGGMAISRLTWGYITPITTYTQRKYIIHGCIALALCMHLLIWFIHSDIANSLSAAVVGLCYGPIFPSTLDLANGVLPEDVHMVSMAIISSFASFGSSLFPFITGLLSNIFGVQVLTYVTVAQTATMFLVWFLFPSSPPHTRASTTSKA
ncbi:hypothetical protein SERLA73DRAFT_101296 [Serpula lacrymans var. lacrymans S7.3]|uniref:Major facilitator superfamily (MFS) profile domain-containing protein n=1 Tax=Serpula lacrymans var. lacrymans (strain S7.3) TaxID=936435 RepID=F8PJ17_SERL3|nr:hypothetical protein SERLA73DRAFT_101296 [Serpula lacrymans var. lacrymans S7.3]